VEIVMTRMTAHLVRGGTAATLIAWAVWFGSAQPALAIAAFAMAVVAMRGCPACWMLGLYDRISETRQVRRSAGQVRL
jgi:hypothetical protein